MNLRKVLQGLAVAAVVGAIMLMSNEDPVKPAPEESLETAEEIVHESETLAPMSDGSEPRVDMGSGPAGALVEAKPGSVVVRPGIPASPEDGAMLPPLVLEKGEQAWESTIRQVLETPNATESEKGRRLLELMPGLPVEGRETATEEAVRRLANEDYRYAQNMVTNPGTYGLSLAVLWQDLMNRPAGISLPTLLTVARNPSHPYAETARENLDLMLGQDYGTDWPRWDAAIREKLSRPTPAAPR